MKRDLPADVLDFLAQKITASVRELEEVFLRMRWPHVYVLGADRLFVGAISVHDLAPLLKADPQEATTWPATVVKRDYPRVREHAPVWQVLETFARHPGERLPVVDEQGRLRGHVTKTDLVLMFRERLAATA